MAIYSKKIFSSENSWNSFNKRLSELFQMEYTELEKPDIITEHCEYIPWNKGLILGSYSEEHKKAISKGKRESGQTYDWTRKPHTDEWNKKLSISNMGVKRSEETKKNCSKAAKNRWKTKPIKRKPLTEEQKKIISEKTKLGMAKYFEKKREKNN